MARKFKKKLARKIEKSKAQPLFSITLIRKEYLKKVQSFFKRLTAFTKTYNLKPKN